VVDLSERLKAALSDRYRIERELGSGGMANVYLAEDLKHRRHVAIKVMLPELSASLFAERFLREIEITANLNHPHILPLLDSGAAEGSLYYVMPLVEGESLRDRLNREKQLPVDEAAKIASEVADALSYAHGHNVIHRDIKPENIMLEAGHAVVADFGIARAVTQAGGERLTETGIAVGTPAYLSPEQASGDAEADGRSDVYSLGCVLHEMLTGEPPFTGPTAGNIIRKHISAEPTPVGVLRPTVSEEMALIVKRSLAKSPADRFATAEQFCDALKTASRGEGAVAESLVGRRRMRRWPMLLVVVAVAVTAIAWWITTNTRVAAAESRSSAVLPCEYRSKDSAGEYLSDRWTEELIGRFSHVAAIAVKSLPTVRRYKGTDLGPGEIARELRVGSLVWCRVSEDEEGAELGVQLIRAENEQVIWSRDYRGELTARGVNSVQSQAVRDMAAALGAQVSDEERQWLDRAPTESDSALRFFRLGRHFGGIMTPEALLKSLDYYEQATAVDSNFALAYAAWAEATDLHGQIVSRPPREFQPEVQRLALRALDLDETISEAHSWLAKVLLKYRWDWPNAEREHRLALRYDPNSARSHLWYGQDLSTVGRHEEAIAVVQRAVELEPVDPFIRANLGFQYLLAQQYEQALVETEHAIELDPDQFIAYWGRSLSLDRLGDVDDAVEVMRRTYELSGESVAMLPWLARAYAGAGKREEAEQILDRLKSQLADGYVSAADIALVFLALGARDSAFAWLERAYEERSLLLLDYLAAWPLLDQPKDDPRFLRLSRLIGLDEW
jgi:serine/threonine-protein kinase